jgi:hypothetical protein
MFNGFYRQLMFTINLRVHRCVYIKRKDDSEEKYTGVIGNKVTGTKKAP